MLQFLSSPDKMPAMQYNVQSQTSLSSGWVESNVVLKGFGVGFFSDCQTYIFLLWLALNTGH